MKKSTRVTLAVIISFALVLSVASCASVQQPKKTGFLGEYYGNLEPGPKGGAEWRWIKPGVDIAKYDKVMLDRVVFYFAPDSEDKGIDPEVMKELADDFNRELANALKDKYPIVGEPGPGVLRVRFALTGIRQSRPVLSGASSIIPVGLAVSIANKTATDAWVGSGATSAEMMVIDSVTSEVLACAEDEKIAGFSERFSRYGSAREAFKFWSQRLRQMLDHYRAAGKAKQPPLPE